MFVLTTRQVKHPSLRHDDSDLEAKCVIFLYFLIKCYFAVVRHISTFFYECICKDMLRSKLEGR